MLPESSLCQTRPEGVCEQPVSLTQGAEAQREQHLSSHTARSLARCTSLPLLWPWASIAGAFVTCHCEHGRSSLQEAQVAVWAQTGRWRLWSWSGVPLICPQIVEKPSESETSLRSAIRLLG